MKPKRRSKNTNPESYRPQSYWKDSDPVAAILRNVKSTNRREMIIDYWSAGRIEELFPENLADDPDPEIQHFLEMIHPPFMGGAYLPELLPTEVEIARVELESTTSDVISIRARLIPKSDLIHYRIVDEYDTTFDISPATSAEPLTHAELVALIDGVDGGMHGGLALCYNETNYSVREDADRLRHFTTVNSLFYPDLYDHYEAVFERWADEKRKACEEEEDPYDE